MCHSEKYDLDPFNMRSYPTKCDALNVLTISEWEYWYV